MRENSWLSYTEEDDKNVEVLAQEYKEFLSNVRQNVSVRSILSKKRKVTAIRILIN